MRNVLQYLNPIARLGTKQYSILFPLITLLLTCIILEVFVYMFLHDPNAVGLFAIFVFIALIIYFSFRDGVRAGFLSVGITIAYYFYIIYTRRYTGNQLEEGINTTIILGLLYFFLAGVIGWLKQTIDTLIEKEAEEKQRLQAIVQQMPVGVLITDSKGRVVQGNKHIEQILGRKMREGLTAGQDTLLVSEMQHQPVPPSQWPLAQALATGRAVVGKEFALARDKGRKTYVQISASVIRNKKGKIVAAVSIVNDVTEQKELERRKDDFVNMASHELKTPITSMKLYIDSLQIRMKQLQEEKALKTITSIKYQTERLQKLVNDLLDVSRLQTGKLSYTKEQFDLDELVRQVVDELQESTQKKLQLSSVADITVLADRFRMYQVLTNLITNAIKYSPNADTITIRVKKEKEQATISVKDFGIGIDKMQQKKIFERLYQVTDDQEKTFPGFGMGLYISKEIVTRHKGKIWVESEKGKGSTFFVTLPVANL